MLEHNEYKKRKEREWGKDFGNSRGKLGQVWVAVFSRPHWSGDIWEKIWGWWGGGHAGIWWRMSQCESPTVGAGLACSRNSKEANMAQAEWAWARIRETEDRGHGDHFPGVMRIQWRGICKSPCSSIGLPGFPMAFSFSQSPRLQTSVFYVCLLFAPTTSLLLGPVAVSFFSVPYFLIPIALQPSWWPLTYTITTVSWPLDLLPPILHHYLLHPLSFQATRQYWAISLLLTTPQVLRGALICSFVHTFSIFWASVSTQSHLSQV